jgi:hypothetical protein
MEALELLGPVGVMQQSHHKERKTSSGKCAVFSFPVHPVIKYVIYLNMFCILILKKGVFSFCDRNLFLTNKWKNNHVSGVFQLLKLRNMRRPLRAGSI